MRLKKNLLKLQGGRMLQSVVLLFSATVYFNVKAANNLTSLHEGGIQKWEPKVFYGNSTYTVNKYKGRLALQAISHNSASGWVLKKKIDITITPYLNWS